MSNLNSVFNIFFCYLLSNKFCKKIGEISSLKFCLVLLFSVFLKSKNFRSSNIKSRPYLTLLFQLFIFHFYFLFQVLANFLLRIIFCLLLFNFIVFFYNEVVWGVNTSYQSSVLWFETSLSIINCFLVISFTHCVFLSVQWTFVIHFDSLAKPSLIYNKDVSCFLTVVTEKREMMINPIETYLDIKMIKIHENVALLEARRRFMSSGWD